jgi:uncharacterized iron-regulated membrane protein
MKRTFLFYIHSIAGLISGLFILLMSLSGSVLVFHEELDSWQYPQIMQVSSAPVMSINRTYQKLQQQYPHAQISSCSLAEDITHPFVFSVYDSSFKQGKEVMQVFMHPQTGAILKIRGGENDIANNFMSWLKSFHNSFRLKEKGEWLLGVLSVIFLISMVTGIILFRKKIKYVLSFNKGIYTIANIHQVIGVYALLFNLMIAGTGFWMQRYVFKKEFYAEQQPYTPVIKPSSPLFFNLDSALKQAKQPYPDFTGYVIYFAQNKQRKTAVYGSQSTNSFIHAKKFADALFLDSAGSIAKTAILKDIPYGDRRDIINSQIHFGKYGGWPVKIFYSLFGLTGGLLSITGFALWVKRRKQTITH